MQYRELGETGVRVPILGFGCMRFPVRDDGKKTIDEPRARRMLDAGLELGCNYWDTAYTYHHGMSESLLGRMLEEGRRDRVLLATKLPCWLLKSRAMMAEVFEEQLRRLRTDRIDFYLLHSLKSNTWPLMLEFEALEFVEAERRRGRIGFVGFSFHDQLPLFKEIADHYDWDFCQIQLNYLDEKFQAGLEGLEYAAARGLGVVIMEPLQGGALADGLPEEARAEFERSPLETNPVKLALRYLWDRPDINLVLSGMSALEHVRDNIEYAEAGAAGSFSPQERRLVERVRRIFAERTRVNCTRCRYCIPCPSRVNIPGCFEFYNYAYIYADPQRYRDSYRLLIPDENRASGCVDCGECADKCPQQLPIPELLRQVAREFEADD